MNPEDVKNLKKVDKVKSTAAERLAKLGSKAELPVGGEGSGAGDERVEQAVQGLLDQVAQARQKYPNVCAKCGAPSGPDGCSLAIPLESGDGLSRMVKDEQGNWVKFDTQCDELAEFTRLVAG